MTDDDCKDQPEGFRLNEKYYWLDTYQKNLIDSHHDNINRSAEKLEKISLWLWGIYSPVIGISSGLIQYYLALPFSNVFYAMLLTPAVLLIFAYYVTISAQSSKSFPMDFDSDRSLKNHFFETAKQKTKDLNIAKWLVFSSCVLIPIALLIAATQIHQPAKPKPYQLATTTAMASPTQTRIIVSGYFPANKEIFLTVENEKQTPLKTYHGHTDQNGKLQFDFTLPSGNQPKIKIRAEWQSKQKSYRAIAREVLIQ